MKKTNILNFYTKFNKKNENIYKLFYNLYLIKINLKNGDENMKKEIMNCIIWTIIGFIVGIIIGTFLIGPTITGNAINSIESKKLDEQNNIKAPILPPGPGPQVNPAGEPDVLNDETIKNI